MNRGGGPHGPGGMSSASGGGGDIIQPIWKREQEDDVPNLQDGNGGNFSGGHNQSDSNAFGGTPSQVCDYSGSPGPGPKTPKYAPSPSPSESSVSGPPGGPHGGGFPSQNNGFGYNNMPMGSNGPNGPGGPGPYGSPSQGSGPGQPFNRQYGNSGPGFGGSPGRMGPQFGPHNGPGFPGGPGGGPGGQFNGGGIPPESFNHSGSPGFPPMMNRSQQIERMESGLRRHNSNVCHTEHRVFELNMRIQQRTDDTDNCWWDSFATEFFEDDAQLTILFCLDDGPKRYTIGRTLIPRFFRSIFDGGVSDLYFQLQNAKESFHNTLITLDCDHCTIMTQHGEPFYTKVCADARLILEFIYDDYMRIKSWHMTIKGHREMIPRSVIASSLSADPVVLEQISKNITRSGITNATLNYLRLCDILEPMQELMSRHKAFELSPRDCLKTTLFQKWQRMVAPTVKKDGAKPPAKKRKRKAAGTGGARGAAKNSPVGGNKRPPSATNFPLAFQDVMVVGEPTLMGGEIGEEDERLITRLNNNQYDSANPINHENHPAFNNRGDNSPLHGHNPNLWNKDSNRNLPHSPASGLHGNPDLDKKSPSML